MYYYTASPLCPVFIVHSEEMGSTGSTCWGKWPLSDNLQERVAVVEGAQNALDKTYERLNQQLAGLMQRMEHAEQKMTTMVFSHQEAETDVVVV